LGAMQAARSTLRGLPLHRSAVAQAQAGQLSLGALQARWVATGGASPTSETTPTGQARAALPVHGGSPLCLYENDDDLVAKFREVTQRCRLGAILSSTGFACVAAGLGSQATPVALAVLLAGAASHGYALLVRTKQTMRQLAKWHVDRVLILPPDDPGKSAEGKSDAKAAKLAAHGSAEQRLEAEPELRLEIRTANLVRRITLTQGARFSSALVEEDKRVAFAELCQKSRPFFIDPQGGQCPDRALLAALVKSPKVVSEEQTELREDAEPEFHLPPGQPASVHEDLKAPSPVPVEEAPIKSLNFVGLRALVGGVVLCAGGGFFLSGKMMKNQERLAARQSAQGDSP